MAAAAHRRVTCTLLPTGQSCTLPCAVLANSMVALGLLVGTRLLAFLVLLVMHRLKKI